MARKLVQLRIFSDDEGKMNRSVQDTGGQILVVSQFTLLADARKGNRPSYVGAAPPPVADALYQQFVRQVEELLGQPVPTGEFGADMQVSLLNDGPVTLVLDSPPIETTQRVETQYFVSRRCIHWLFNTDTKYCVSTPH